MAVNIEDDKIIAALKHTLQHISLQQAKFKDIDVELQQTKQELAECAPLKTQMEQLRGELNHFKSLFEEQTTKISELEIKCVTETQRSTALSHELQKKNIMMEEIKVEKERNAYSLVNELENDNKMLQKQVSILETKLDFNGNELNRVKNENIELQQTISIMMNNERTISQQEEKDNEEITMRVKQLEDTNNELSQKCEALVQSEKDTAIKYQNYSERMLTMGNCSFRMLESCRNLRRCVTNTTTDIVMHQQNINEQFQQEMEKIGTVSIQSQNEKPSNEIKEAIKNKFNAVKDTKVAMIGLRQNIETELNDFDSNIKHVQRVIFQKKSTFHDEIKKEKDKAAKLTECLMENEQNMEQKLTDYLRQKEELQSKINKLEGFLTDKQEKDIVAQMKRFRSAAIVTSITSLSEDGNKAISYHKLSEHERKAISLRSKLEKRIHSEIDINEKVDEFIRSGGLKRYPILEQEFSHEPNDLDSNRFRFVSKYISISYNMKHNELYVKNEDNNSSQLLQEWIAKNGSIEMRKLLAKVSMKKKTNRQLPQPKKHMFA